MYLETYRQDLATYLAFDVRVVCARRGNGVGDTHDSSPGCGTSTTTHRLLLMEVAIDYSSLLLLGINEWDLQYQHNSSNFIAVCEISSIRVGQYRRLVCNAYE